MKRSLIVFTSLLAPALGFAQQFAIKGKVNGNATGYLYLYYNNGQQVKDSSLLKNGAFSFKGSIKEPTYAILTNGAPAYNNPRQVEIFLEPGDMTVTVKANDYREAVVTGSATQREYDQLHNAITAIRKEMEPLSKAYDQANDNYISASKAKKSESELETLKAKANAAKEKLEPFYEKMTAKSFAFFHTHPDSYVTAYQLRYYVSQLTLDTLQGYFDRMSPAVQQSTYGQNLAAEIAQLKKGSPGSPAQVFATKDINGQPLSLSDFNGKYVLLDFWASWCVPCRKGNPHLKELYSKYKDKGFEIIGISDNDGQPEEWKKAVEKDGIGIWKHVLRGLDMEKLKREGYDKPQPGDISNGYGIHSLPTQILIDPNGVIIGRYGGGGQPHEALDTKLMEVFGG